MAKKKKNKSSKIKNKPSSKRKTTKPSSSKKVTKSTKKKIKRKSTKNKKSKKLKSDVVPKKVNSIKREGFNFNMKQKYRYLKNFKVKKKYRKGDDKDDKVNVKRKLPLKFIIPVVLLLIIGIGLYVVISNLEITEPEPLRIPPKFSYNVLEKDIVSYGRTTSGATYEKDLGYFLTSYTSNASKVNFTMNFYDDVDSKEVYILDSQTYLSDSLPVFKSVLTSKLKDKGYNVKWIHISSLDQMPKNSILVVPSGKMPLQLMQGDNNIMNLMNKSTIVIYIGYPMNDVLDETGNHVTPNDQLGFRFTNADSLGKQYRLNPEDKINMRLPVYLLRHRNSGDPNILYGAFSSLKINNGFFIALPQYLDSGWESGDAAAEDVSLIIENSKWHSPLSSREITFNNQSGVVNLFSNTVDRRESGYVKLIGEAISKSKGVNKQINVYNMEKSTNGFITTSGEIYPTAITQLNSMIKILFSENESYKIYPYLEIYDTGNLVKTVRLSETTSKNSFPVTPYLTIDFPPAEYLMVVRDEQKVYAKGYLPVKEVIIDAAKVNYQKGEFAFVFKDKSGKRVDVSQVSLYLNGEKLDEYVGTNHVVLSGKYLDEGNHTFSFEFSPGYTLDKNLYYKPTNPFDPILKNPLYIFLGVITVIAIVFAFFVVKPKKETIYGLDIPNFPTVKSETVPIFKEQVFNVFNDVNRSYSWEHMPLKLREIKKGFKNIVYDGKPIHISDYNLEILLDDLISSKDVLEKNYLYILNDWVEETGNSLEELIIYRKLRDIFLENVIRFSNLDENDNADVEININGRKMYLHIFDGDYSVVNRTLNTVNKGKTILVFNSKNTVNKFYDHIVTPNPVFILFKLEVDRGNIITLSVDELEEYLRNFKKDN